MEVARKRVKFLDSIAGLADPNKQQLDQRYAKLKVSLEAQKRSPRFIDDTIAEQKSKDRYAEAPIGFTKDWAFKTGDEALVPADLAEKWEQSGICVPVAEKRAA